MRSAVFIVVLVLACIAFAIIPVDFSPKIYEMVAKGLTALLIAKRISDIFVEDS